MSSSLQTFVLRIIASILLAGAGVVLLVILRATGTSMTVCIASLLACIGSASALISYAVFMVALERRAARQGQTLNSREQETQQLQQTTALRKNWATAISSLIGLFVIAPLLPITLSALGISATLYVSLFVTALFLLATGLIWSIYMFAVAR